MNLSELFALIDSNFLDGGRRTTAANARTVLKQLATQAYAGAPKNYIGNVPPGTAQNGSVGYVGFSDSAVFSWGLVLAGDGRTGSLYVCTYCTPTDAEWTLIFGS